MFTSGKTKQHSCWEYIAKKMTEKGYNISGKKCCTKFQTLKRTYKQRSLLTLKIIIINLETREKRGNSLMYINLYSVFVNIIFMYIKIFMYIHYNLYSYRK